MFCLYNKMTAVELHAVASNITDAVAFMIDHAKDIFEVCTIEIQNIMQPKCK